MGGRDRSLEYKSNLVYIEFWDYRATRRDPVSKKKKKERKIEKTKTKQKPTNIY